MSLINPGNQESNADGNVELRIAEKIDESTGCTFCAEGLPDGLEFERKPRKDDEEKTWETGRIVGAPVRAGIYQVTVTAKDKDGNKTSVSFIWTICALRAYRFALDLTPAQITAVQKNTGAARFAFNFALGLKVTAHEAYTERRQAHLDAGLDPDQAKAALKKESAGLKAELSVWDHHRQCLLAMQRGRAVPDKTPRGPQELIDRLAAIRAMVPGGPDPMLLSLVEQWDKRQLPEVLCWVRERQDARQDWIKEQLAAGRRVVTQLKDQIFGLGGTIPNALDALNIWRGVRDLPKEEGGSPWWPEVSSYAFSCGMNRADAAWNNWLKSLSGQRAGHTGYPRFKKRGRCVDSVALYHDVNNPSIRLEGYRHLTLPKIGEVRVLNSGHRAGTRIRKDNGRVQGKGRLGSTKRLVRMIERGDALVNSVSIVRGGHRWYANVLVKLTPQAMHQRELIARAHQGVTKESAEGRGKVGVEWGVRTLATVSNGDTFENPRPGKKNQQRLRKASQAVSRKPFTRGQPVSANRTKAVGQLGKVQHQTAEARKGYMHQVTAAISLGYGGVAVRGLNVRGMTKSAKGTTEKPGKNVKVQAAFNRAVLDAAPATFQQFLRSKTTQYGVPFGVSPKDLASSQTCSVCGWRDPSIPLEQLIFRCGNTECPNYGVKIDREVNSARVIRDSVFPVDPGQPGHVKTACGDGVRPEGNQGLLSMKQEDPIPRPPPEGGPGEGHFGDVSPRRSQAPR